MKLEPASLLAIRPVEAAEQEPTPRNPLPLPYPIPSILLYKQNVIPTVWTMDKGLREGGLRQLQLQNPK